MKLAKKDGLDHLDLMILTEMEADGRRSVSDLAKKLGISRVYAGKRLQNLLDQQITRIVAFTNPLILGYRTVAIVGIQVLPSEVHAATKKLSELANVHLVLIAAGQHDIVIWSMFRSQNELSDFLGRELGAVPGVISTETMIVLHMRKLSFSFLTASKGGATQNSGQRNNGQFRYFPDDADIEIDQTDLMILKEMERDARQPVSTLARKLGTSRSQVSNRLKRLLEEQLTRIVAFTNPVFLGYNFFSLIGMKFSPSEIDEAVDRLSELPDIFMVARTAGRYDVVVWAVFKSPLELSAFLTGELAAIPGITSTETIIALELKKMAFMYLASSLKD